MKKRAAFNWRRLFPIIGILLAISACSAAYLFVVPTETPVEKTMNGILLYGDDTAQQVEVQLTGTLSVYYFGNDNASLYGTIAVDGAPVAEHFTVIFDGEYGTSTAQLVCHTDYRLAASVEVEGRACLLVAPAEAAENPDAPAVSAEAMEDAAALLAELLPYADPSWGWSES